MTSPLTPLAPLAVFEASVDRLSAALAAARPAAPAAFGLSVLEAPAAIIPNKSLSARPVRLVEAVLHPILREAMPLSLPSELVSEGMGPDFVRREPGSRDEKPPPLDTAPGPSRDPF
jgi:hypothetical protein